MNNSKSVVDPLKLLLYKNLILKAN